MLIPGIFVILSLSLNYPQVHLFPVMTGSNFFQLHIDQFMLVLDLINGIVLSENAQQQSL